MTVVKRTKEGARLAPPSHMQRGYQKRAREKTGSTQERGRSIIVDFLEGIFPLKKDGEQSIRGAKKKLKGGR